MDAQQLQNTLAKSLTEYLAEIKTLAFENETLRIQQRIAQAKITTLENKLRKAEDYAAILAGRADSAGEDDTL